ncbi:MAG: hypothetical protein ACI37V_07915 [Methanobrevibacter sp.]
MGLSANYICDDCGFTVNENDTVFCLDFESRKIREMLFGKLSVRAFKNPVAGYVYETYCNDCKSYVKRYVISQNESELNEEEITNFILENYQGNECILISFRIDDNSDEENQNISDLGDDSKDFHVECPKCGEKIPGSFFDFNECPRCGSKKFYSGDIACFD